MTPDEREAVEELLRLAQLDHYHCEDCWYSCPKSHEGCCNDRAGHDCNCGAETHNARVTELAALLGLAGMEPRL
jgi:hypothetical protein